MSSEKVLLLAALDEAFDKKSWHGPNLRAAYWKYAVRRRLLRGKRGSFMLAGSNFFERPEGGAVSEAAWKNDIAILEGEHRNLRETVAKFADKAFTPAACHLIRGSAAHDLYHAGQIRLLRRMCRG